jgi:hypothetical protein
MCYDFPLMNTPDKEIHILMIEETDQRPEYGFKIQGKVSI